MSDLPLEIVFYKLAENANVMPYGNKGYVIQYKAIVNDLEKRVYPKINEGLALLSNDPGIYTNHGPEHFDEVIKYAGHLLGVVDGDEDFLALSPYELYVLLMAIRFHDAGNAYGREEHEKQIFTMLNEMGGLSGNDNVEKKIIADIGQAHGGRTPDGDKDTIGTLNESTICDSQKLGARKIAAIVRFADEICESRSRINQPLLLSGKLPAHSEKYHKYAECIQGVHVSANAKTITINYVVNQNDAVQLWGGGTSGQPEQTYIIDEILNRLTKMNCERIYCNKFMKPVCEVERIKFTIDIVDNDYNTIETIEDVIRDYDGYPNSCEDIKKRPALKAYCGESIKDKLNVHTCNVQHVSSGNDANGKSLIEKIVHIFQGKKDD